MGTKNVLMTPNNEKYVLCIDDTGTRDLNSQSVVREDSMDWFALGGVLVKGEHVGRIGFRHKAFCEKHRISYPLHSSDIRCKTKMFKWLTDDKKRALFTQALGEFITSLPMMVTAAVVHRPGYFGRYQKKHGTGLWNMDKTAYCILIERAAKFAQLNDRKLEIRFEQAGKKEDQAIVDYTTELKNTGSPFNPITAAGYRPLQAIDYSNILLGSPIKETKKFSLIQLADLVVYPIAKAGYQDNYPPYYQMTKAKMLIDQHLNDEHKGIAGIKYYCFPA